MRGSDVDIAAAAAAKAREVTDGVAEIGKIGVAVDFTCGRRRSLVPKFRLPSETTKLRPAALLPVSVETIQLFDDREHRLGDWGDRFSPLRRSARRIHQHVEAEMQPIQRFAARVGRQELLDHKSR